MEKVIYLLWTRDGEDPHALSRQLLDECAPALLTLGPERLSMNLDDADASVPPPVPEPPKGARRLSAEVCVWLDCYERREPYEEILTSLPADLAGYLVTESLYCDYGGNLHGRTRDWPDGARSPGVLTVTLLERPARLTHGEWVAHWHGVQSPVSEEIQPRPRYVRNQVVRALTKDAPEFGGIVDEAWPSAETITDPMLFYLAEGSPETMKRNIERMLESVQGFLDLDRIHSATMSEYFLKS
jgi:hypothetical protein